MSELKLYLLGPPRAELDGERIHLGRKKALALLAYLTVTRERHRRDSLATLLWPEYDQSGARADLRRTLSLLNRALGEGWLVADRETAGLDPDADPSTSPGQVLWLDVDQFRQLLAACNLHSHPETEVCSECVPSLEAAVELYRDDFMVGFTLPDSLAFDEWQFFQTEGLRDDLAGALERLVRGRGEKGEYEAAIACARRWLELDRAAEGAHRALMGLYVRTGQTSAALRQYQLCERALAEELGVPPSAETTAIYQRLRPGEEIAPLSPIPTGTVTFLFTDVEGSMPLWEREPEKMAAALQIHNAALREAIESHGGVVFKTVGDAFQAAFSTAPQALEAAVEGQRALSGATWNELGELKVRMGLHTGEAEPDPGGDEYAVSHTKNRVARIMSAAHGGQILLSAEAAELIHRQLPLEINLKDLGAHHLKGLLHPEHLCQAVVPELPADFPPLASESRPSHNLPLELTSFIGRQREIAQVQALLREQRLVTLVGSGGVGKTRLSIQAVGGMLAEFPDGTWYVELAPISDPDLVPRTVAAALGLREEPNRPILDILGYFLSQRELLLVLDNCEHLLEACAQLADALLRQAPRLSILTSSREALGVAGEHPFHVPSLTVPDPRQMPSLEALQEYEAVQLFTARARSLMPSFQVHAHNAEAVTKICQRLDGIPLALELAAARLNMLTTEQLASRLDNAFRLLTGGSRTALPRQQTLRAAIDWSYQLLSDPERILLRRLAVFAGGGTLEGIEAICAGEGLEAEQILDLLSGLVSKSMVSAERKQGEETRYRLLETVRQYAREKLAASGSTETFQQRHLTYFRQFAETAAPFLKGPDLLIWLYRLEESLDNIRVALDWAQKTDVGNGLRLIFALTEFCWVRGNIREMEARLGQLLAQTASVSPLVKANGIWLQGWFSSILDHHDKAIVLLEKSLNLYRELEDQAGVASALTEIGHALHMLGEIEKGHVALQEAITLHRSLGDTVGTAWSLMSLGEFEMESDHHEQAWECFQESVSLFREAGNLSRFFVVLLRSGLVATEQGDFEVALSLIRESLSIVELLGIRGYLAYVLQDLGKLYFQLGDYPLAQTTFEKSLLIGKETESYSFSYDWTFVQLGYAHLRGGNLAQAKEFFSKSQQQFSKSGDLIGIICALEGLASLAVQQEQPETAVRLFAWADMTRHLNNNSRAQSEQTDVDRDIARLLEMIDKEAYAAAYAAGQAMTMAQAIAHALGDED